MQRSNNANAAAIKMNIKNVNINNNALIVLDISQAATANVPSPLHRNKERPPRGAITYVAVQAYWQHKRHTTGMQVLHKTR